MYLKIRVKFTKKNMTLIFQTVTTEIEVSNSTCDSYFGYDISQGTTPILFCKFHSKINKFMYVHLRALV